MNIFAVAAGFTMAFVMMQIISFNVEGQGGLAATSTTSTISITEVSVINVTSTGGFLSVDYVVIGSEIICHTGRTGTTFTGLTRGCRDTDAQTHAAGVRVYNETTSVMNQVIGFNIAETMSTSGPIRVVIMVPRALMHAVPKLIQWDYSYLEGDLLGTFPLAYFKYIVLYPLSGAFIMGFAVIMINVFMGIARIFTG
jgi:hypothetical protein